MLKFRIALLLAMVFAIASTTQAQSPGKRVAFVVGESAYISQKPLNNPARDAGLIAKSLLKDGFVLVGGHYYVNLDRDNLYRGIQLFAQEARGADAALFYFSGHGMELGGANYLAPVNLSTSFTLGTVGSETLRADSVLRELDNSGAKLKIIVLDACRDDPFQAARGIRAGLAEMTAPAGTLIGFATQPNSTASDGPAGGNSPYATALSSALGTPGFDLFAVFNQVGLDVMSSTSGRQQPWMSSSPIAGKFYFRPPEVMAQAPSNLYDQASLPVPTTPVSTGQSLSYIQHAWLQLADAQYNDAVETLTHGIEVDYQSALPYSYRGFARYLQGLADGNLHERLAFFRLAFPDLDKAILLDKGNAPSRRHHGNAIVATYVTLKLLREPVNDIMQKALIDLHDAANIDPTSARNTTSLGMALLFEGEVGDATLYFDKALRLNPHFAAAYVGRCMAERLIGKWQAARDDARKASASDDYAGQQCLNADLESLWLTVRPDLS